MLGDLPAVDPDVQSGEAASLGTIGADLAEEEVDDMQVDEKPVVKQESTQPQVNGHAKKAKVEDVKMEEDDGDDDDLEAYMTRIEGEKKHMDRADAKRHGRLYGGDEEEDDDTPVKSKGEAELEKAEALLA